MINLVRFRCTAQVFALQSGLQQDLYVLHFKHVGVADEVPYSRQEELAVNRYSLSSVPIRAEKS
jgi:hypothetical protein